MDYSLIEALCVKYSAVFEYNASLEQYCSMKVGGKCDILVKPNSEQVVLELIGICRENDIPFFILGKGTNVLFKGFRGAVILIGSDMGKITVDGETITAGAGASLNAVCRAALENSLSGAENLYGIPGSVGGALYMNAGAFGSEIKDIVISARCIDENGNIVVVNAEDMDLSYRHSVFSENKRIILSAVFGFKSGDKAAIKARMDEVMKKRKDKQPLEYPSCGSTFKRPTNGFAAALIEECGLKGFQIGGAQVSEKHSGFVINKGGASYDDIIGIVEHIKNTVQKEKGVELECEMIIVDK